MNRITLCFAIFLMTFCACFAEFNGAQEVTDITLKVQGLETKLLYFGFSEGDEIIFNLRETAGKPVKEIEVFEYPAHTKFQDFKTSAVNDKRIKVSKTGIYAFRIYNSALGKRVCQVHIERIPKSEETKDFSTEVHWKDVMDTTYTPVQERYLVRSDTLAVKVVDQVAKLSSSNALNGNSNTNVVDFSLPEGTISWSYYIGVGREGQQAYNNASKEFLQAAAGEASKIPGYGPLAALALHGLNFFNQIQGEDNVKYSFITNWENVKAFEAGRPYYQYKQGDVVNDATQMKKPLKDKVYLGMLNDNIIDPIEVMVKVTAITVTQEWAVRTIKRMDVSSSSVPYLESLNP